MVALGVCLCFRRRKRQKLDKIRKAEITNGQAVEKAQLHSEDLKPVRRELPGDRPSVGRRDGPVAEMAANEDPQRTAFEMPSNNAVESELQGESNERNG